MNTTIQQLSKELGMLLLQQHVILSTAESCTGGGIAYAITETAGSSGWFDTGFATYTPHAKETILGVPATTIKQYGVVSEEVAKAMAQGACEHSLATMSVATTGIAGPTGAEPGKPVGTVCFGYQFLGKDMTETMYFNGDRQSVREQSIIHALRQLIQLLTTPHE